MSFRQVGLPLALVGFLFISERTSAQPDSDFPEDEWPEDRSDSSVVYAYGHLLAPPYEFTGIGSDTLFLNGHPYSPTRPRWRPYEVPNSSQSSGCHERIVEAREAALAAAIRKNAPLADLNDYIEALNEQPFVEWAMRDERNEKHVILKMECSSSPIWIWYPLAAPGSEIRPPSVSKEAQHEDAIRTFWRQMRFGMFIAFGQGYQFLTPVQNEGAIQLIRCGSEFRAGRSPQIPENADGSQRQIYQDILRAHDEEVVK